MVARIAQPAFLFPADPRSNEGEEQFWAVLHPRYLIFGRADLKQLATVFFFPQ